MTYEDLPAVNATLNAASAILVTAGWFSIKHGNRKAHKNFMIAAVVVSAAFLTCYVIYHLGDEETKFQGEGWIRIPYFAMLISHIVLAVAVVPMVGASVYLGLKDRLDKHVRIARWTFAVWMYVSITGVLIYFTLYHLY